MTRLLATLRLPILVCWLCTLSLYSHATETPSFEALFNAQVNNDQLERLAKQLNIGESAQGKFTQYRYLKVLKQPLISQGEFIFKEQLGLAWLQHSPFESALILTQGNLIQIDSDGNKQLTQASDNQEANNLAQMMPTLMSALLRGNIAPLAEQFSLHLVEGEQGWQLGLIPLDNLLAKAMSGIVLQGSHQLDSLTLLSSNGDRSQIKFEQLSNAPLSDKQLDYFLDVTAPESVTSPESLTTP